MVNDKKIIARNTLFLYCRMLLIMFVTLYTYRVTLKILGVDDYGIYQTIAGAVTFLAFLSNALGSGTSRFITFEMGKEKPELKKLFSTVRVAHIVLGLLVVVVGELVGLWFIYNKLVIPADRFSAAILAFHFSMVSSFFQITQVPYNACIIAHEEMNVYALIGIVEALIRLSIVFVLKFLPYDKLEVYAIFMCATTAICTMFYRVYCKKKFEETKTNLAFDKCTFKAVASFSGWNLISSSAASLANQGVTVVTNMFFSPAVVTLRSLALNVNSSINQFIGNFRTAVNPQIIKKYASGEFEDSKKLALASTQYTYYLMLVVVVPLFLLVEPALKIWLDDVPMGLIPFVQIALIQGLFQAFDTSLYVPIYAKGRIKENAIISPMFDFIQLPVVYVLFKLGYPPIALAWVEAIACVMLGIVIKPVLVKVIVGYSYKEVMSVIMRCMYVTVLSIVIPVWLAIIIDVNTIWGFGSILFGSIISICAGVWFFGIDKEIKIMVLSWVKARFTKKK